MVYENVSKLLLYSYIMVFTWYFKVLNKITANTVLVTKALC